jgi:tetratricopeptide (TPR) repeat protein
MRGVHNPLFRRHFRKTLICALLAGLAVNASTSRAVVSFDPLLDDPGGRCGPPRLAGLDGMRLAMLSTTDAATKKPQKSENGPLPTLPVKSVGGAPMLYRDLGNYGYKLGKASPRVQAFFNQGLRLAVGFNHAEAQRAFKAAQALDPKCGMCFWGEALVLGPNINAPMEPEAVPVAMAALKNALALKDSLPERERGLVEALAKRYTADAKADRSPLDAAYADAMLALAKTYPDDDLIAVLAAEAAMDTQPWDYWQAGGKEPKGRTADMMRLLETVMARAPKDPAAIHFYIHAVEGSNDPGRALAGAKTLAALMPGAGHMVHMPAHIYYRVGLYRESLDANKDAINIDEGYFKGSPSDPVYKLGYYPHNIHFLMVSAQMGGDGAAALRAAAKLDAAIPEDFTRQFTFVQPVKAAPYFAHALFSTPAEVLALPAPPADLALVRGLYHYARAVAYAKLKDQDAGMQEIAAIAKLEATVDFKPFADMGVPAQAMLQTARLVASARLADARGDLDAAAKAYETAIVIEDSLAYTEPPYWYYPIRQSLGAVLLRQGKTDAAETMLRDSLVRVRNNGWALAALADLYKRKGDAGGEESARRAFAKAWFGPAEGPRLEQL